MTGQQIPSWREAQALFIEIVQITLDRINHGTDVSPWEALTLGQICGVATRYPGVQEALHEHETKEKQ